jgi:hypothetical protein
MAATYLKIESLELLMRLQGFQNIGFQFLLVFTNDQAMVVNLSPLIDEHVAEAGLDSAKIDVEWGCLEFCNGAVDIDPTTLYRYASSHND